MLEIRIIEKNDNPQIASIIKEVLTEYGADPKTTMLGDPKVNYMYEQYLEPNSIYFVAILDGELVGGCGIKQLMANDSTICELQRMYLLKKARGLKIGKKLIDLSLEKAKKFNFSKIYLETISNMAAAQTLYKKYGFKEINNYLGDTGHSGCDVKMLLEIA